MPKKLSVDLLPQVDNFPLSSSKRRAEVSFVEEQSSPLTESFRPLTANSMLFLHWLKVAAAAIDIP